MWFCDVFMKSVIYDKGFLDICDYLVIIIMPWKICSSFIYLILQMEPDMDTPVILAAYKGHQNCVKLLIESGADPTRSDKEGVTPLHCAALK